MKQCIKCTQILELSNFQKDTSRTDGFRETCRKCYSINRKNYKSNDYQVYTITITNKTCSKCKVDKSSKEFNKDKTAKDGLMIYCKECRVQSSKDRYLKNKDKIKAQVKEYIANNKEKVRKTQQAYQKKREKEDILFRLSRRLRNRLYHALEQTYWKKGYSFNDYIGCTLPELRDHLEKQFTEGMTWNNYGQWHIDHIEPLSKAESIEDMHKRCHHSNLQPMWAEDNIKKGNK